MAEDMINPKPTVVCFGIVIDFTGFKINHQLCIEYCGHIWDCAPSCNLELFDKLQKRICRTVCISPAVSLEPLAL